MRAFLIGIVLAAALIVASAIGLELLNLTVRPPQPLAFGTLQWWDETGFTVDRVRRSRELTFGNRRIVAAGEFYVVDARVVCPFGERYHWDDARTHVEIFAGVGGSGRRGTFGVDEPVQRLMDATTGRRGPRHEVLGAEQRERLVFDLPRDIEQPAIVFADANDPVNALDLVFGTIWSPHRFNLRMD